MPVMLSLRAAILLLACARTSALDNGFVKPALGWSSWYAAPEGSQVTEEFVKGSATALISSGLAAKGYVYVNVDEGWLKGRYPGNNSIYEDLEKFPSGMKGLGEWVHAQSASSGSEAVKMKYGLYSCRGTCQCGTRKYSAPGSHGFEAQDTQWMIDQGADWLKIDSCCGSQDHATAFSDYAKFRDAMNASGKAVWFNLCGWEEWYAPPDPTLNYTGGASLGNSWRIYGDGGSFGAITGALNTMAKLTNYTKPGGYSDPDNILGPHGTVGRVTESQARVQMVMWSIFPTQLILGEDVTQMSAEYIETVGNTELIAINQDAPFISAASRIVGGDLTYPCTGGAEGAAFEIQAAPCAQGAAGAAQQHFYFNSSDSSLRLASEPSYLVSTGGCDWTDGNIVSLWAVGKGGTGCGGAHWTHAENGQVIGAAGKCLDEYQWTTPRVDLWTCESGATNELWKFVSAPTTEREDRRGLSFPVGTLINQDSGKCLTATPSTPQTCTNVWSRPLANGDVALAMVNHGANASVVCDAACFAAAGLGHATSIAVRDLIAHANLPPLHPPFSLNVSVVGDGGAAAFRLTPTK